MNWKQINSGLWKAEEGGYLITANKKSKFKSWHWCIDNLHNDDLVKVGYSHTEQSAKQAAEEAFLKFVK